MTDSGSGPEWPTTAKLVHRKRSSTACIVKSSAMVTQGVGYDAGKKIKEERKRFVTVDTLNLSH